MEGRAVSFPGAEAPERAAPGARRAGPFRGMVPPMFAKLKAWAAELKRDARALWLAYRDPRTPWYAKAVAAAVAVYAFSPIDLIPDFIPVLGYLDDLLLVPLGVALALRLVPAEVMAECRERADRELLEKPRSMVGAVVVVAIWVALVAIVAFALFT